MRMKKDCEANVAILLKQLKIGNLNIGLKAIDYPK